MIRTRRATIGALGSLAALLVGFACLYTPDTDPALMRARYGGPPSRFIEMGEGLTVHVRDTGPRAAPALMLVHGANASLHVWEPWPSGSSSASGSFASTCPAMG